MSAPPKGRGGGGGGGGREPQLKGLNKNFGISDQVCGAAIFVDIVNKLYINYTIINKLWSISRGRCSVYFVLRMLRVLLYNTLAVIFSESF